MLLCIYAYVCHRGSCIARICIMQPDAATLGAYVTRYISRSLVSRQERDENRSPLSFRIRYFFSILKCGDESGETVFLVPFPSTRFYSSVFSTHGRVVTIRSNLVWTRYLPGHCRNLDRRRSSIGLSPSSRPTTESEKFCLD